MVESIVLALLAAFAFAGAAAFQFKGTKTVKAEQGTGFVKSLLRRPVWLLGFGLDAVGWGLSAIALIPGTVVVVQPILTTSLIFAIPIGALVNRLAISKQDVAWAALLAGGLVLFTLVGNPTEGEGQEPFRHWIIPLMVLAMFLTTLIALAFIDNQNHRATILAVLCGTVFGCAGAITKPVMDSFDLGLERGLLHALGLWETYVLIALLVMGSYAQQVAYRAGNLRETYPAITALDPLVAVALGIGVLHERLQVDSIGGFAAILGSIAIIGISMWQLAKKQAELQVV